MRRVQANDGIELLYTKTINPDPTGPEFVFEYAGPVRLPGNQLDLDIKADLCLLPTATNGNDNVNLSNCSDTWSGLGGHDNIYALAGNDTVHGNAGNDDIYGGTGNDHLYGDEGQDYLNGGEGDDHLFGGEGHDGLSGGDGNDQMFGGDGSDNMWGHDGFDLLMGGAGYDNLMGQGDADTLYGGADDDDLSGGQGNDQLHGDEGEDVLQGDGGRDELFGGVDADLFVFTDGSTGVGGNSDRIWDFSQAEGDEISLYYNDDSQPFESPYTFEFVGYANNVADGEVGYYHVNDDTRVIGREDGSLFEIEIVDQTLDLSLADFSAEDVI
ncbi:MAG: calcium-binding protein [Pseudomonadota bacterium]